MSARVLSERLLGLETEYALSVTGGGHEDSASATAKMMALANDKWACLPCVQGAGVFLANGARFYIDAGSHPEFCTPEVDNPWDLVSHLMAGDAIMAELIAHPSTSAGGEIVLHKCNVDYSGMGTTWACHENYGYQNHHADMPAQLIPHLVSRIIYTGAGGFDPHAPGIEFCLSPRVHHLNNVISSNSTADRGIFHLKDEPLAGKGWHRLHVLCGESVCSHLGAWLKSAVTALVVAMVEGGLQPAAGLELRDALGAMKCFNADPDCRAKVALKDGRNLTALEIQRRYLECAEANLRHPCMQVWADKACRIWHDTLARLEQAPHAVNRRLDWAIKRALYFHHLASRGITAERLAVWNEVVTRLWQCQLDSGFSGPFTASRIRLANGSYSAEASRLTPLLEQHGLSWTQLPDFLRARTELCEMEVRYSQIGRSLFASMDAANLLEHRVPGITEVSIQQAVHTPPQRGRARVRGKLIQELRGANEYHCDWGAIWDLRGRLLDLSDPFLEQAAAWEQRSLPGAPARSPVHRLEQSLATVNAHYDRGEYENAFRVLQPLAVLPSATLGQLQPQFLEWMTRVQCRRGFFPEALAALNQRFAGQDLSFHWVFEFAALYRFHGLIPDTGRFMEWAQRGEELLPFVPMEDAIVGLVFKEHQGYVLSRMGRLDEARAILEGLSRQDNLRRAQPRITARIQCALGDVYRMLGRKSEAIACLDDATLLQQRGQFHGDFAELNLLGRAKADPDRTEARRRLSSAKVIQQQAGNRMGLARSLALEARLFPDAPHLPQIKVDLGFHADRLPSLTACPLMQRILRDWDDWIGGRTPGDLHDFYWGL